LIDDLLAPLFFQIVLKEEKKGLTPILRMPSCVHNKNAPNTIDSITSKK
jgi:hypothetical protein